MALRSRTKRERKESLGRCRPSVRGRRDAEAGNAGSSGSGGLQPSSSKGRLRIASRSSNA